MIETLIIKALIGAISDAVSSEFNDLSGTEIKSFVKENLGGNAVAEELLSGIVNEVGKRV
tara:strand:- start:475 stop:654 length:180 start_codon:yes stop_codon:yes gene_type:complete